MEKADHQAAPSPARRVWGQVRRWAPGIGGLAGLLVLIWLLYGVWDVEAMVLFLKRAGPLPFYTALALLPAIGMPTTPFFIVAGMVFDPWVAALGNALAIAANLAVCWVIGHSALKSLLVAALRPTRYALPEASPKNPFRFTLIVKLAPGIPVFIKHYVLCLAGIPFLIYFQLSFLITFAYASTFFIVGDAIVDRDFGQSGLALLAIGALVGVLAWLRSRVHSATL
jgi:uncharacterized membrane protein YdjX (TVP38/TMEM64 family)